MYDKPIMVSFLYLAFSVTAAKQNSFQNSWSVHGSLVLVLLVLVTEPYWVNVLDWDINLTCVLNQLPMREGFDNPYLQQWGLPLSSENT